MARKRSLIDSNNEKTVLDFNDSTETLIGGFKYKVSDLKEVGEEYFLKSVPPGIGIPLEVLPDNDKTKQLSAGKFLIIKRKYKHLIPYITIERRLIVTTPVEVAEISIKFQNGKSAISVQSDRLSIKADSITFAANSMALESNDSPPDSPFSPGKKGTISFKDNYLFLCYEDNRWTRFKGINQWPEDPEESWQ